MANKIYPKYKEALLGAAANVSLTGGNIKVMLVDLADYIYDDTHEFLTSVPAGARVATSGNLAGKTVTDGVFDHDNVTWATVSGDQAEAVIYYVDTGVEATSRLVAFLDTGQTGLPVTPNSGDINWNPNAAGAFGI